MTDRDISPEEKLLRLIKLKDEKEEKQIPQNQEPKAKVGAQPDRSREVALKEPPQLKNILFINKILFGVFIILVTYFLIDYFFLPSVKVSTTLFEESEIEQPLKREIAKNPYSYYEKEIQGKDLFKPLLREDESEAESAAGAEEELEDIAGSLSLLGLVSGDNPQAIIEDKKKGKTYFLNKGDSVGEIKLKDILEVEGKVTLIYKGKEFNLVM